MLKIMGFPGEYVQGPNALSSIGQILKRHQFQNVAIIYDQATEGSILKKASDSLEAECIQYSSFKFSGECSYAIINALNEEILKYSPNAIIGLGGGKAMDTAKAVAKSMNIPIIICPTIASNDAPTSRLIIIYDEFHKVQAVEKTKSNPEIVIVDTEIIVQAPARFFSAGIGDAISKMFEANQCHDSNGLNSFGTPPLETALLLANSTYRNLLKWGKSALDDVKLKKNTSIVEKVVESTVLLSGLGFESGGLSLAHALIRGLTAVPQLSLQLHGELVAYGTVVQAILEKREPIFIEELRRFLKSVDLPTTIYDLGYAYELKEDDLNTIISNTLSNSYSENFVPKITPEALKQALIQSNQF